MTFARARDAARRSHDPHTQVGCVITRGGYEVARGTNACPLGVQPTAERLERPEKYKWIEHAERAAIYEAARKGTRLLGCVMHLPWFPCCDCARAIVASGLHELVCIAPDLDDPRWGEDFKRALVILEEGRVVLTYKTEEGA